MSLGMGEVDGWGWGKLQAAVTGSAQISFPPFVHPFNHPFRISCA